jgi:hypothetical protein
MLVFEATCAALRLQVVHELVREEDAELVFSRLSQQFFEAFIEIRRGVDDNTQFHSRSGTARSKTAMVR